ncbi:MAG TPA: hypothetical protein VHT70_04400 [Candidatus Saccharimonadales bacterium]|jgi:hypothetical protein|nr:hypothetical protein [Candidatus Saccharimonadales bacterium]
MVSIMQEMSNPNPEQGKPLSFIFNASEGQSDLVGGWQVEGISEPLPEAEAGNHDLPSSEIAGLPSLAEFSEAAFGVPEDHFDITQFNDMTSDSIGTTVVDGISRGIFSTASEMYPDFVFPMDGQDEIVLEHRYPSGESVRLQSFADGMHVYEDKGDRGNWYRYVRTPNDNVMYREDNPISTSNLPTPGEVSTDTYAAITEERYTSEAPIRKLAAELGDGPRQVSIPEMRYLACIAANAEPKTVTAYEILHRVRARADSPLQPSDERAATAAPLFDKAVRRFLERNKLGTDTDMVVVGGDAIDPLHSASTMQVHVGRKWRDDSENLDPFVELRIDYLLGPEGTKNADGITFGHNGKHEITIHYGIQDGKLQSTHHTRVLDHEGEIERDWPSRTANAETEDVKGISHFLRGPKFNLES